MNGVMRRPTLSMICLSLLLSGATLSCDDGQERNRNEGGEGEGEGEQQDGGLPDGSTDAGDGGELADLGTPDVGDPWDDQVKKKDGILLKQRAEPNPSITVVYTLNLGNGNRRLCYWRGESPEQETDRGCLELRVGNPSTPAVSPDGRWVTFTGGSNGEQLLLADLDDGTSTPIRTTAGESFSLRSPAIARDGAFLAYQKVHEQATHIVRLERANDEDLPLWEQQGGTGAPVISGDGGVVAFHSDPAGNNEIWRWSAELQDITNLSDTGTLHEKDPDVSADGKVICYRSSAQPEGRVGQIVVAADERTRDITSGYDLANLNNWDCRLSGTGRHVVFRSLPGALPRTRWLQDGVFYVYDLNADAHRVLPEPTGVETQQVFSPWNLSSDGRYIVFTAPPAGSSDPDVWLLSVETGETIWLIRTDDAEGTGAPAIN